MSGTMRRRAPFNLFTLVAIISAGIGFGGMIGAWPGDPADSGPPCHKAHTGHIIALESCAIGQAVGTPARSAATPLVNDLTVLQSGGVVDTAVGSTATAWCEPNQRIVSGGYWLEPDLGATAPATPDAIAAVVTASRPVSALGAEGQLLRQGWEVIVVGATGARFTVYAVCLGR